MPAGQNGCRFGGMEQIFQADGTVRVESIRLALMIQRRNARAAIVAVHIFAAPFHPTNAALVAVVIISLNAVIKKVAHGAKICGKRNTTGTRLRHGLSFVASSAHHLFHSVPIHFMRFGIVVAVAARIHFVATRGHQTASANIVFTTNHALVLVLFFGRTRDGVVIIVHICLAI
jgi:hypothetical protein